MKNFLSTLESKLQSSLLKTLLSATLSFLRLKVQENKGPLFIRDGLDLKRVMITVYIALLPATLIGIFNIGYQAYEQEAFQYVSNFYVDCFLFGLKIFLPIYLVSFFVGSFFEVYFAYKRKHEINEGFLITSLLFSLTLPPTIPLWQVALGISFAIVLGKEIFGGTGKNLFNPALLGRSFLFFSYPVAMSGDKIWIVGDGKSGATILGKLLTHQEVVVHKMNAFIGLIPGSIGEVSKIACLLGAAYLIYRRIASYRIIVGSLLGFLFVTILSSLLSKNTMMSFGPLNHFLYGSFCFATVFMATDPVSAALTRTGQWIYGFCIGSLGIIIRIFNPAYPEGFMLAILFMNVFAPLIDFLVLKRNIAWRKRLYEK